MIRTLTFIAAAFALCACATAPPHYGAATSQSSVGYYEQQVESNRYFVTFQAPNGADADILQDYALLRAADLTLEHNRTWFWLDRHVVDAQTSYSSGPSIGVGLGGVTFGGHGGLGASVGLNFPLGGGGQTQTARSATVEIRLGDGPKPEDPNAYDARSLSYNIRSHLNLQ